MKYNNELDHATNHSTSWVLATAEDSDFYIPNALHPERNDALMLTTDDATACLEAESEGIPLIYNMDDVPCGVYVDTEENRNIIRQMLEQYPKYKNVITDECT